ncbi:ComF family protein [Chromohalobacter moromii]|nr:ComF family protein [Chromohalobacter moromii]
MMIVRSAWELSARIKLLADQSVRVGLPGHCAFCMGMTPQASPWCEACFEALPWNCVACARCAEPLARPAELCGHCLRHAPSFDVARAPLRYEDASQALLQRFKFGAQPRAGILLATLFVRSRDDGVLPEALIAVPTHPQRRRERGFDHSVWLTRELSRQLGVPHRRAWRERDTPTQRGLTRRARRGNVRGAFRVMPGLPAHVAIVDDVMTTGSTLSALADACRRAGAQHVEAWAMTRTPRGI